jgi:hypothetical protein
MKLSAIGMVLGAAAVIAGVAWAEPYVDYTPEPGAWRLESFKVDANRMDNYLTGLRKSYIPALEILKKNGIIDQYMVVTKMTSGGRVNVMIMQHYPSMSKLDPNKDIDQAIRKELGDKAVAEYEKYRTLESDDFWTAVDFPH